jgi:hypothetical protein
LKRKINRLKKEWAKERTKGIKYAIKEYENSIE